ncbi:uncharacterized protein LOC129875582 [Solanum dulcamara]|uniref:uncharacterized protein LOC129875582 n=1 Tax=Solanum dulcamara TaxID=45834 RepID=UPI002484F025|nr:uncharacterized protein LOC129875582 [Solanum dulcamara]
MSHFNPLSSILNQNKPEGPNCVDWEKNLDIVLTSKGFKYVPVEEHPIKQADVADEEIQAYDKWIEHQSMTTAYDMLKSLKEMLVEQNRAAKGTAMKALLTTKMFCLNYSMNKKNLSLEKLLNELTAAESIIKHQASPSMAFMVYNPVASFSKSTKAQKKKKKPRKVVALADARVVWLSQRASAFIASSLVTIKDSAPTIKPK